MAADPRSTFFAEAALHTVGGSGDAAELAADGAMQRFLEDAACPLLVASVGADGSGKVQLANAVDAAALGASTRPTLAFIKTRPVAINTGNMLTVVTSSTLQSSPLESLAAALAHVYAPLVKEQSGAQAGRLQTVLAELRSGLASELRLKGVSSAGQFDEDDAGAVQSPADEFNLWTELAARGDSRAREIAGLFEPIARRWEELPDSTNEEDVLETLETTQDALDDVWKLPHSQPYRQARMQRLMEVAASAISRYIHGQLSSLDLWTTPYPKVERALSYALRVCRRFVEMTETLTGQYWATFPAHPWKGEAHSDDLLKRLEKRVEEILSLRTVNHELNALLTAGEQHELRVSEHFAPFAHLPALATSDYNAPRWAAAVAEYEKQMVPVEQRIAEKLKDQMHGALLPSLRAAVEAHGSVGAVAPTTGPQPQQLLRSMSRYSGLLQRPAVGGALSIERSQLMSQLQQYANKLKDQLDNKQMDSYDSKHAVQPAAPPGFRMTGIVSKMVFVSQLLNKTETARAAAVQLLAGVPGVEALINQCEDLTRDLSEFRDLEFKNWKEDMTDLLSDSSSELALQTSGRVMQIDFTGDKKLRVNYSGNLVNLLREVRQLQSLGFSIPMPIVKATTDANQFYRLAVTLKQVANFYNSIDAQMLDVQKPMLIEAAKAFESAINQQDSNASWSNVAALEAYIQRLQAAATELTTRNRKLRDAHDTLIEKAISLFSVDLVRQRDQWKDGLRDMRKVVEDLQKQGFRNETIWCTFIDKQIYKALDHQYSLGLESLNEGLPGMNVKLVFKQKKLQFEPPLEEIRAQYYREVKRFLSIPLNFRGVSATGDAFKNMSRANSHGLAVVFKKAEKLFAKLQRSVAPFNDWVALGTVDLDQFLEKNLKTVSDWELNFKVLKQRNKELERLPTDMRVDCFTVATQDLKATIESHMKALSDGLTLSLVESGKKNLTELTEFLSAAITKLDEKPQSLEEIRKQQAEGVALYEQRPRMAELLRQAEEKSRLLRQTGSASLDLVQGTQLLEEFESRLSQHEAMIAQQKEELKSQIDKRLAEYNNQVEKFAARWQQLKPAGIPEGHAAAEAAAAKMKDWQSEFAELDKGATELSTDCEHFGLPKPEFPALDALREDMTTTAGAWKLYNEFSEALSKLTNEDWISFRGRLYELEDLIKDWREKLSGRAREEMVRHILGMLDEYLHVFPLLSFVRGEAFTADHWGTLFRTLKFDTKSSGEERISLESLTLGHFLNKSDLMKANEEALKDLAARARGEVTIREAMDELDVWGAETVFSTTEHAGGTALIKDWKDLLTGVGDNQSLLLSLKESQYFKHFKDRAQVWEDRLVTLDAVLHLLNPIQRKWVYLEPIFGRGALPHEQARFRRIDEDFKSIMNGIEADPRVVALTNVPNLQDNLTTMLQQLERCQKALSEFLEEKRARFPRFYFIGDDDLLEILGQAKNPRVIQSHLKKLFAGIHSVEFTDDSANLTAMCSIAGEVVPLTKPVPITEQVEEWLDVLSNEMRETLTKSLEGGLSVLDLQKLPSQILCVAENVYFSQKAHACVERGGAELSSIKQELLDSLAKYTSIETGGQNVLQLKTKSVVLDVIHNMDVIDQLTAALQSQGQVGADDWVWQKQLRFYMEVNASGSKICRARMCDASFDYTYEYQGNAPRLVHTPLTDKCYLTLTQGMHLGYGGNPYGPAGTGKTESVKALAQALGRQCLVFNCDEGIDFKSMGRIFTGLVKCGAWGCFDEFNRLEEAVLSAVSQQIQVIQSALKERSPSLELLGMNMEVNPNAGIFVTLNPAGKGYGGRSKLPDNLKQLFRSVAMTAPDMELIAETILFSESYKEAKVLGRKVIALFTLSKQLLSYQIHYDWGLRALKPVLSFGGQLIAAKRKEGPVTPEDEEQLIIQALRVNTLSKLTFEDSERFQALIADVFPNDKKEDVEYPEFEAAIREVLAEQGLQCMDKQLAKILQLHEATRQRMGVTIVGPSGTGKSTLWRTLEKAYAKLKIPLTVHVLNPKSMPRQQLLGNMDLDTREWTDGVMTANARKAVAEPVEHRSWIVCDGDIDPEWIESLNSVLDDNHLLTMPSGERIQFGPNVNFIFETHSLKFASPATVSRNAIIFLSDEDFDVNVLIKSWLNTQPEATRGNLSDWMEELFVKGLDWVQAQETPLVETTRVGLVFNGFSQLNHCASRPQFLVGMVRGLAGGLAPEVRAHFANWVFQEAGERMPNSNDPLGTYWSERSGALDCYQYDASNEVDVLDYAAKAEPPVLLTPHIQSAADTVMPWLLEQEPMIIVGPEGAGKSLLLRHLFRQLKSTAVATIHCSALTNAVHVIQKLSQACTLQSSSTGRVLRPKGAERLVLYLKDLNLPKPDMYDTVQLISFLQQLITYKGYFDTNLEWIGLENVQIVGSMCPTGMGRYELTTRFSAIVRFQTLSYPARDQLGCVYTSMLRAVPGLSSVPELGGADGCEKLASAILDVWEQISKRYTLDDARHYFFTPRDLTSWVYSLVRYSLGTPSAPDFFTAWVYEGRRLFGDRMVTPEAKQRVATLLQGVAQTQFHATVDTEALFVTWGSMQETTTGSGSCVPVYEMTMGDMGEAVTQKLVMYERENKELGLVLFPDVLETIARVDRVISEPGGHILMAGRSGVGRRSCLTVAAYLLRLELISPQMTRSYDLKAFMDFMKTVLHKVGVEGSPAILHLEDHQLVTSEFLEVVNSLISGGEVPGLYTPEELEQMLSGLADEMQDEGVHTSTYAFFVSRVQRNLHVALSMDPTNTSFLKRCESNPAMYTRCSIQWMESWSRDGMMAVPRVMLSDLLLNVEDDEEVIRHVVSIHESCGHQSGQRGRAAGFPQRQFCSLLTTYNSIFAKKQSQERERLDRMQGGLGKLTEAQETVDILSQNAHEKQILLAQKQAAADEALQGITERTTAAVERKGEVEKLSEEVSIKSKEISERKVGVEAELAEVQPLIEEAQKAVGNIKQNNIDELRFLKMPPDPVRDVLQGVLSIMGIYDTSWNSMKSFLGKRGVIDSILNFDCHNITPKARNEVQKLLKQKATSFQHEVIHRASVAGSPLAAWVKANIQYSIVLEKVAPLEQDLAELNQGLDEANSRLQACQLELAELDEKVAEMKAEFGRRTAEAEALKQDLIRTQETLDAAQSLLGKLGGEKSRWDNTCEELRSVLASLPIYALLAAAFSTYLGNDPEAGRRQRVDEWAMTVGLPDFDYVSFMSVESQRLQWKVEGLPADQLSVENAIVIESASSTPYIIDPSTQAVSWLQKHMSSGEKTVNLVNQQDQKLTTDLELSVRFGRTIVVQEVDSIDPIFFSVLRKDLVRQGPRWVVAVGDKMIDYHEDFRMYMVTRNPDPQITPDTAATIAMINFSITRSGLEDQLLSKTITAEQPELEKRKSEILQQEEELKVQLVNYEKSLLEELSNSEGNILENKALLQSLDETKAKSMDITTKLAESAELQGSLNEQREVYRQLARDGSNMFFIIKGLTRMDNMYQYSLEIFFRIFEQALQTQSSGSSPEARIASLGEELLQLFYAYVSRSLFKADRLTFSLHLCHGRCAHLFEENEWELFTGELVADAGATPRQGQVPDWVPSEAKGRFAQLLQTCPGWTGQLGLTDPSWMQWIASSTPEVEWPPRAQMSAFQKLLFLQACRSDRLETGMAVFAAEVLGHATVSQAAPSLARVYEETISTEPILLITTPGSDPSVELEDFAVRRLGAGRFQQVAMGQGQADKAMSLLRQCAKQGDWLCLKNVHLVVAWLPEFEKELNKLLPTAHEGFRLWLTTEPHLKFPTILLQQSLKMTFEAPPGLKKNLLRTYEGWGEEQVQKGSVVRAQVLFVLAWFHAVVQERRKFIPHGWTKFYEFSPADLRAGADIIEACQQRGGGKLNWETIHGLFLYAVYGGRIDNDADVNVLKTYLDQYFNDDLLSGSGPSRGRLGRGVTLPQSNKFADYIDTLNMLPDQDPHDVFGLPGNIGILVQRVNSAAVLAQLRSISRVTDTGAAFDREVWARLVSPFITLWNKLNVQPPRISSQSMGKTSALDPVDGFVKQQVETAENLLALVGGMFASIEKVARGAELLSPNVQAVADRLIQGEVPDAWDSVWEGPTDPKKWLAGLASRVGAIGDWAARVKAGAVLSSAIALGDLFEPKIFFNALRQQTARVSRVPVDELKLVSCWEQSRLDSRMAPLTLTVRDMLLQGCNFDGQKLSESLLDSAANSSLGECFFAWVPGDAPSPYPNGESVKVPLYSSGSRSDAIADVLLPSARHDVNRWVLAGVALFVFADD